MNTSAKIFLTLILVGTLLYFRQPIKVQILPHFDQIVANVRATFAPCSAPITYKIDTFDTKFGISEKYFLNAIAEAEAIWEKPINKDLFAHDSERGVLKINLLYDYRQDATEKLEALDARVIDGREAYNEFKSKYVGLKSQYASVKADYDTRVALFEQRQNAYHNEVQYWNQKGGAPKAEYQKLQAENWFFRRSQTSWIFYLLA